MWFNTSCFKRTVSKFEEKMTTNFHHVLVTTPYTLIYGCGGGVLIDHSNLFLQKSGFAWVSFVN